MVGENSRTNEELLHFALFVHNTRRTLSVARHAGYPSIELFFWRGCESYLRVVQPRVCALYYERRERWSAKTLVQTKNCFTRTYPSIELFFWRGCESYSPSGEMVPTLAFRLRHPKQAVLAFEGLFEKQNQPKKRS
jgi:hypothetical protein